MFIIVRYFFIIICFATKIGIKIRPTFPLNLKFAISKFRSKSLNLSTPPLKHRSNPKVLWWSFQPRIASPWRRLKSNHYYCLISFLNLTQPKGSLSSLFSANSTTLFFHSPAQAIWFCRCFRLAIFWAALHHQRIWFAKSPTNAAVCLFTWPKCLFLRFWHSKYCLTHQNYCAFPSSFAAPLFLEIQLQPITHVKLSFVNSNFKFR